MIYLTGDTHRNISIEKVRQLFKEKTLTQDDYLIVAGDFGTPGFGKILELDRNMDFWNNAPCQILFVDGNHENFGELNALPVTQWKGGKIHELSFNVKHLMRGQVFDIDGKRIFTMGGATSPDKCMRTIGIDWFKEEELNYAEMDEAICNLLRVDNRVDYVVTHTIGSEFICKYMSNHIVPRREYMGPSNTFFDYISDILCYKHWYFGHFHDDVDYEGTNISLVYNRIIELA